MKIVIDLPKEYYESLKEMSNESLSIIDRAIIRYGTPLPKNHGRLIDVDGLYEKSRLCHTEEDGTACVEWREINNAPTIIEASEEVKDDESSETM